MSGPNAAGVRMLAPAAPALAVAGQRGPSGWQGAAAVSARAPAQAASPATVAGITGVTVVGSRSPTSTAAPVGTAAVAAAAAVKVMMPGPSAPLGAAAGAAAAAMGARAPLPAAPVGAPAGATAAAVGGIAPALPPMAGPAAGPTAAAVRAAAPAPAGPASLPAGAGAAAAPAADAAALDLQLKGTLALVEHRRAEPALRERAYQALLEALAARGAFDGLPVDGAGCLDLALPFCGSCSEAPLLLSFLAERLLDGRGPASSIRAAGCDSDGEVLEAYGRRWEAWTAHALGPRVRLELRHRDLAAEALPAAGLILGVHPLVSGVGAEAVWRRILANVLQARVPGGRCIFATFYDHEAQKVQRMCLELGSQSEIVENPFYQGYPRKAEGTHLRFAVLVAV
uniref:Uncharacterized protein n=1 Tax=Alexandrium monilatum TaxID=311494 RepID=A0A7S4VP40_9DINO